MGTDCESREQTQAEIYDMTGEFPAKEGIGMSELRDQVREEKEYLVRMRRDFHRHPELASQEKRTAGVI